ncbi:MAG: hydroxyacid dehydrogenase [Proteobacteria bacterium]|nr:hydroxyacid dehydrogenase [Pseudomonadota bacterium]
MNPIVLLTNPIDESGMALLRPHAELRLASAVDHDTLRREAAPADAMIVRAFLPADVFEHTPRLRACVRHGAGVDMIPVEAATAHGVIVANVPGVNAQTVAEYCAAQFLLLGRRIARMDRTLRREGWAKARALADDVSELHGKTAGIVGVGHIGARVAAICHHGLGMRVLGHQRRLDRLPEFVEGAALDRIFSDSDFIALCCPMTPETRHLADARRIGLMKPTAVLVNVSRGPVVDQAALVAALRERRIGGAGLDVFEQQPLAPGDPLFEFDNVVLTPHLAGLSLESMQRMSVIAAEDVLRILAGDKPVNFFNPEVWPAALRRRASLESGQ